MYVKICLMYPGFFKMALLLKNLLESVLYHKHTDWQLYLIQNWADIVGTLHTRMYLEKIQNDTLFVGVYDPHWMHELFLLSSTLVRTINARLGADYIVRVRFKLARQKQVRDIQKQVQEKQNDIVVAHVLSDKQKYVLAQVKDVELKEALQQFLFSCLHRGT